MLLHRGVELLREVIRHVGHAWLLLVGSAQAALVLARLLAVLLLGVLAVPFGCLKKGERHGTFLVNQLLYYQIIVLMYY